MDARGARLQRRRLGDSTRSPAAGRHHDRRPRIERTPEFVESLGDTEAVDPAVAGVIARLYEDDRLTSDALVSALRDLRSRKDRDAAD